MEKYGTIFDSTFNFKKDRIYYLINEYFDNPKVKKIKNNENESIYIACNDTELITDNQCIVCTCLKDSDPIGTIRDLKSLKWIAFQTRMLNLNKNDNIQFSYSSKRNSKFMSKLMVIKRSKLVTDYKCTEYDIIVSLLHENENEYEYPNIGVLSQALESFKTIITFM